MCVFYKLFFSAIIIFIISPVITTVNAEKIKWDDDKPEVIIKASGRFSKLHDSKLKNSKSAPPGTLANILAVDNYNFKWKPSWNFIGMGGALLPFVHQNQKQNVLGIVETLPQKGAPDSSIIVFINLYNLEIINYTVLPGRNVRRFCYIPNSRQIVCLVKRPLDKYYPTPKYQFLIVDTHNAEISSASKIFKDNVTAFCCSNDGSRLFVAYKNSNELKIYSIDDLEQKFTIFKTVKNPIAINRSLDGSKLFVTGSDKVQIFDASTDELISDKFIKLPEYYHPDKTVLCANDGSTFLVSQVGDNTYFYNGRRFVSLCKRSDTDVAWWEAEQRIVIGEQKKSKISIYNPSNLESPESDFYLERVRPKSLGKPREIVCLPGKKKELAIIDNMGGLNRLYKKRRRWKREIIIEHPSPR